MASKYLAIFILGFCLIGCQNGADLSDKLFQLRSAEEIGIDFENRLEETRDVNVYTFRNFYNGAGVGVGDFDNDGWQDIFFCGNQVDNKLYKNNGDFTFRDITAAAGVASENVWSTGVSIADINGDGLLDFYVCKSGDAQGANRHNELFINTGLSEVGLPIFEEQSKIVGLDDLGLSTHAAFFDYDLDGDLDCYLLNNSFRSVGNYDLRPNQRQIRDSEGGNKLFRNQLMESGQLQFMDVSEQAGIFGSTIGFGLGVTVGDINVDGWPDIFVSNDFFEKDYLYINNSDGTFTESIDVYTNEISMGSMGADLADLNNDGYPELFVTEMLPAGEKRLKSKAQFENWNKYSANIENGYHKQFGRNVLQLNLAGESFVEIGRFSGVEATDWSWGALLFDMDNDGQKDIFVANGIFKDLLDQDYINFYSNPAEVRKILFDDKGGIEALINKMPSAPLANYAFGNNGNMTFESMAEEWGLHHKGFSNGAAFADFDNDGDLDLVVNNINAAPYIYENNASQSAAGYISVQLVYLTPNNFGIGGKVQLFQAGTKQSVEMYTSRGFMSSITPIAHFGLNQELAIDSIVVLWPNGKQSVYHKPEANKLLTLVYDEQAIETVIDYTYEPLFHEKPLAPNMFSHAENATSDFDKEPLLFQMHNNLGPATCMADFDNNGTMDIFLGGASGQPSRLFLQNSDGILKLQGNSVFDKHTEGEDIDCACADFNNDGWVDLYVARGSTDFGPNNANLADLLYFNQFGKSWKLSNQLVPSFKFENSSSVKAFDKDNDGDMDLVVSSFLSTRAYGLPSDIYLLENDGKGTFQPVINDDFLNLGMVSDLAVADIDQDGDQDIVCVGEWMQPVLFRQQEGKFEKEHFGSAGLWTCVSVNDLDADGDEDIIAGNYGSNNRFAQADQLKLYVNDFDKNGQIEQIFTKRHNDQEFPIAQRLELIKQLPYLSKKFPSFESFAGQELQNVLTEEQLNSSLKLSITEFESGVFWNDGTGHFEFEAFPQEAQYSTLMAFAVYDANDDGKFDVIAGGNQYRQKPQYGIQAASYGLLMLQGNERSFKSMSPVESGIFVKGEIRKIELLNTSSSDQLMFVLNNDSPRFFLKNE